MLCFGRGRTSVTKAKNALRGDKANCHHFAANHARLKMAALAYNLLQMIREFHFAWLISLANKAD